MLFFSLQSCGEDDNDYITIDIEKYDTDSDYNDNDNNGTNNDSLPDTSPTKPTVIPTANKAYLYMDQITRGGMVHQSAACFGDYAFFISNKMVNTMVFNMRTNTKIFTLKQKALGSENVYHCNQACFGTQKYSEEDPFPLLYISQFQNKDNRCFITVFRVLPTSTGLDQEYTSFAFELIQTIYFPIATDDNSLYNVNAVIDTDKHFIYTYSRNNNTDAENYMQCKISKFNIPDPLESSVVFLSDSDILDSYFIPTQAANMQGGTYKDGFLYIGRGKASVGYINLYVVDLDNRRLWFTVDLLNNGFGYEPEGAFIYNDVLYIGAGTAIFKFSFKYENSSAKAMAVPFDMTQQ